jgi:hypothetical protein
MELRPEFRHALEILARGIRTLETRGLSPPVLVGGAAVEIYTGGSVTSGDFDLVTSFQEELEEALIEVGFERPDGGERILSGLIHEESGIALQVVSERLMDGKTDENRMMVLDVGEGSLAVIPVEDLIADRMGQAYVETPPRKDMLDQAVKLFQFADQPDEDYLNKRICEETHNSATLQNLRSAL